MPGTTLASLALLLVVPATIYAFYALPAPRAVLVVFFGSALFLPELVNFDAPLIPPLDKRSLPALTLLVGVLVVARPQIKASGFGRGVNLFMWATILSIIGTTLTNQDPLVYGRTVLPAFATHDVLSEIVRTTLSPLVPFFLGRTLFKTSDDAKDILRAFVFSALVYAPLILIELRLSPQMHAWIYGYGQLQFAQGIRGQGYRPIVFMAHGLALALFMCASSLAAWTLSNTNFRIFGWAVKPIAIGLSVLLALINSMGAVVYGVVATPLFWLLKPRTVARVAVAVALATALYPVARATEVFPTQALVDLSARASQDRAESLKFRFDNEDQLLKKALERPWFGWGGYSRYHIFNEEGRDISTTDGAWIIFLGTYGIVGFVARFGLLLVPLWIALRRIPGVSPENQPLLGGLSLMAAIYSIDLLPNGIFNDFPMFLSGAVAGLARGMPEEARGRWTPEMVWSLLSLLRRMASGGGDRARAEFR